MALISRYLEGHPDVRAAREMGVHMLALGASPNEISRLIGSLAQV